MHRLASMHNKRASKTKSSSTSHYAPSTPSSQDDPPDIPLFEINLTALLETLNIFSLSDHSASNRSREEYEHFTAHRLNRHTGINAFSNQALGISGICTLSYDGEGSSLNVHMSEAGVTTTCELTTYEADTTEEIPFSRDSVALKTIMRSTYLLDAITELSSVNPTNISFLALPNTSIGTNLSLSASGALGSATVDLTTNTDSDTPILETFHCGAKINASFKFSLFKAAQRAMASASKVSLRLDEDGVLSMQYLIEIASGGGDRVAFVDFRVVPLVDGEDGGLYDDDEESQNSD
jgi:cell cycle checkpoint protein